MRLVRPHVTVDAGTTPAVLEASDVHMEVRFENAIVRIHGSLDERRDVVREMAHAVGLLCIGVDEPLVVPS